jgi:hypothetical protein
VDDDGAQADAAHEGDVFEDVADDLGIVHGGPAELDDDGFAPEALDVRQGFDEDAGFLDGLFHDSAGHYPPPRRRGEEKRARGTRIVIADREMPGKRALEQRDIPEGTGFRRYAVFANTATLLYLQI